ncbi:MAG: sugar kinase [Motilibacteraceae bacterium]
MTEQPRAEVLTLGETMVSFRTGAPVTAQSPWQAHVAGAESTVAVALARLGHRVAWVGRVGEDPFGALVVQQLRGQGVEVRAVVDVRRPTGLMFVERRTADLARVTYRRSESAGSALELGDLGDLGEELRSARVVHLTGITPALSVSARRTVSTVVEAVAAMPQGERPLLSFDVNYRSMLWAASTAAPVLRELAAAADVVIASDDELALVDGEQGQPDEESAVARLLAGRAQLVAVKRGARGASLHTAAGRLDVPALPVTAVDELGAGDAFSAGVLSGLLDGLEPEQVLERAAALGAFAVGTAGDWEGLPTRAELALLAGRSRGDVVR